ncbi:MAG: ADP-ribose pyrophosphatase [Candidatus Nanosalina sp. J07AB43]|nr:MAG: ADP-ribose pyrophosphatase [Candidatus Nanosalina sp. J07AB43]
MGIVSWILSEGEQFGVDIISRVLWPPATAFTLVIKDRKLLAVRTDSYLMLPGGIAERGETLRECAVRETREETGIEVNIKRELKTKAWKSGGVEKIFHAEPIEGELDGSWEGEPEYIPIDDLDVENWRRNRDVDKLAREVRDK